MSSEHQDGGGGNYIRSNQS